MDFDEYEYLEKTVEGEKDGSSPARKSAERADKPEKGGYRRRERSVEDNSGEDDDEDRKSKKSRGDDENGAKREDRERSSRHRSSRDGDRDVDRERDRDRDRDRRRSSRDVDKDRERDRSSKERERDGGSREKRDKERDRERRDKEKEREREKDRGDREKDRDRERDRERREREKEKERDGSRRSRSRSMSTRRHDADREREKEIIRERERDLELRESGRRFKDKKEAEPEADPERDQRTVFAYQMPLKATERDVYEFFSRAGKVRDVRLIMDRNSRRSKGVGYIEFYDAMSVPMAIALSGQLLLGQPVMVKPSEAEKNLVQSSASSGTSVVGPYGAADRKLYVGNLHFNMTEGQLKQIFEAFGPVELVQLPTDPETGHCKGFGFIQFAQLEHAKAAQSLNGKLEIGGRTIKVSSVTDHVSQESGVKASDLDDDDGGGLSLNAQSRALLMQKLDRSGTATGIAGPLGVPVLNGAVPTQPNIVLPMNGQSMIPATIFPPVMASMPPEPIGKPSECLLLKNMFDPAAETEPGFDLDIQEDVYEECSKYGHVKHIHVDNCAQIIPVVPELTGVNSILALTYFKVIKHMALESIRNSAGYVYLRFETVKESETAQQAMHKRWFARKLISAIFLQPYEYEAKFNGTA